MGAVYKQEPAGDPHRPLPQRLGTGPQQLQHSRPGPNITHPQSHPDSPHQGHHPNSFPSPHSSSHGLPLPLQHQSPYTQPLSHATHANGHASHANGHAPQAPQEIYYAPSPYSTPVSADYSSAEPPDLMAATHMQRPYPQQPVYHTPQSNSPISVTSQGHDQHGRMYAQNPAQMQQGIYGYSQYQVPPSAYTQHPGPQQQQQQHQLMTSQPLLPHQQGQPPIPTQSPAHPPGLTNSPRPQTKFEPGISRPMDPSSLRRSPTGPVTPNHNTPGGPSQNGNGLHLGQSGGPGINPNAAPGPIPATTPLVVRQDNNGVQWIAFEYSRDRVKMEYTIRCDVESVNRDSLPADFRTENCVYPRACCGNYKGNRLQYENECNTVGWALAELNPCLRGKRGLIQRAVDSWRNSNQDPRLRSRRVRRMAKNNTRKSVPTSQAPNHMAGPRDVGGPAPSATHPMTVPRPAPTNTSMQGSSQLHHHHAHPDGSATGSTDDVSVNDHLDSQPHQQIAKSAMAPTRPSIVFRGYQSFPQSPNSTASIPPHLSNGLNTSLANGHAISTSTSLPTTAAEDGIHSPPSPEKKHAFPSSSLFADLPEAKRRKFILLDDTERKNRVRVKVALETVNISDIPDSYRRCNSVYPRSWFPAEMPLSPGTRREGRMRFVRDEDAEEEGEGKGWQGQAEGLGAGDMGGKGMGVGSVMVPVPVLEGRESRLKVPGLGRRSREKEEKLNDLGYRMSWSQSRTFAGRVVFLQKSLDAYRNKVGSTMTAGGQEVSIVAPHLETRIGKKIWLERRSRGNGGGGGGGDGRTLKRLAASH